MIQFISRNITRVGKITATNFKGYQMNDQIY